LIVATSFVVAGVAWVLLTDLVLYAVTRAPVLRMLRSEHPQDLAGVGAEEFARRFRVSYPDGSWVPPEQLVSQRVFAKAGPLH
jgi:hypothetical protein